MEELLDIHIKIRELGGIVGIGRKTGKEGYPTTLNKGKRHYEFINLDSQKVNLDKFVMAGYYKKSRTIRFLQCISMYK